MGAWARSVLTLALFLALSSAAAAGAFRGCEGFGCETSGVSGWRVLAVTSLANSGPGTLRAAIEARGPRVVLFRVAGYITLERELRVTEPFLTIAGQTAPGGGVVIRNKLAAPYGLAADSFPSLVIEASDVVVRHLTIRPGTWPTNPACTGPNALVHPDGYSTCVDAGDVDGVQVLYPARRVVLDHLSLSYATDELIALLGAQDVTIQHSILSDGLTTHPYCGFWARCNPWGGKGIIVGNTVIAAAGQETTRISEHHNLWAHVAARTPQLVGVFDSRKSITYNWREHGSNAHNLLGATQANLVGDLAIPGPETKAPSSGATLTDWSASPSAIQPGAPVRVFTDAPFRCSRWTGSRLRDCTPDSYRLSTPVPAPAVRAGGDVLVMAGPWRIDATGHLWPRRDAHDARVVQNLLSFGGRAPAVTPPWPTIVASEPYADQDGDGLPDEWERERGLPVTSPNPYRLGEFLDGVY